MRGGQGGGLLTLTPLTTSPTQVTVLVPASAIATPGSLHVTVTNPPPGGGTSNAVDFAIIGPVITAVSPLAGPVGTAVTITGRVLSIRRMFDWYTEG